MKGLVLAYMMSAKEQILERIADSKRKMSDPKVCWEMGLRPR